MNESLYNIDKVWLSKFWQEPVAKCALNNFRGGGVKLKFRARVTAHFDGICTTRNFHNLRFSAAKIQIFTPFRKTREYSGIFLGAGGLILFSFPSRLGGRSNRVGAQKKSLKLIDFSNPWGGGLAPRAPPEYASTENLFQRNYYSYKSLQAV